jgi:hypothetical protein
MTTWTQHNPDTWIVENKQGYVQALVNFVEATNLYNVQKHNKNLGLYTSLEAAKQAALPQCFATKMFPRKPQVKIKQDLPWDK